MGFLSTRSAAAAGDIDIDADMLYVMKGDGSTEWRSTPSLMCMVNSTSLRLGSGAGDVIESGGTDNTCLGYHAGLLLTTGDHVTAVGSGAGAAIVTNSDLTAFGYNAATLATVTCTAVGSGALDALVDATSVTGVGYKAGHSATGTSNGNRGTYVGHNAGGEGAIANEGVGVGYRAASSHGVGATCVGNQSGVGSSGAYLTAVGHNTYGTASISGTDNTLIGAAAGAALGTGDHCSLLGASSNVSASGATYQTAIGAGATCTANNQVMLGRSNEDVLHPGTLSMGATAGAATSAKRILIKKTGINDNSATNVITVTVPNSAQAACIKLRILSSNGSTDAFESSRCAEGMVVLARTAGVDTVAAVAALDLAQIATVGGGATHTLAYGVTAMAGAASATQTFSITLTIDDSGNLGSNQAVILAEIMNSEATGCTMAAA